ncbi:MAG: hypothetical protein JRN62_03285 [Nitrososphaerota archaeon]|jgi:hypothetical protein|nr:hypothetical protein [Nitrososphaerota archaeon]MDG6948621.1 hypothetical protein [Nitrososphaerota archaeon]
MKIAFEVNKLELKAVRATSTVDGPVEWDPPSANGSRVGHYTKVKQYKVRWALVTDPDKAALIAALVRLVLHLEKKPETSRGRVYLDNEDQGKQVLRALVER